MKYSFSKTTYTRGFTFIEMIVFTTVSAMFFIAVGGIIVNIYRVNSYALEQASAIDQSRRGVLDMVQYIREATISDTGSFPIVSAGTSTFIFYSNIDNDTNIEKVRYFLEDGEFKRGIIKSTGDPLAYTASEKVVIIAKDVRNIVNNTNIFTYYDESGLEVTDLGEITNMTFIRVNLIINLNPARAPEDFTLRSGVSIRNLKTNL